jgi:hypothetical protein
VFLCSVDAEMELLPQMHAFQILQKCSSICCSQSSGNSYRVSRYLQVSQNWQLSHGMLVLISSSWITSYLDAICVLSFVKCLFECFVHFKTLKTVLLMVSKFTSCSVCKSFYQFYTLQIFFIAFCLPLCCFWWLGRESNSGTSKWFLCLSKFSKSVKILSCYAVIIRLLWVLFVCLFVCLTWVCNLSDGNILVWLRQKMGTEACRKKVSQASQQLFSRFASKGWAREQKELSLYTI